MPENLIEAIEESDRTRKDSNIDSVLETAGAYEASEKWNSGKKEEVVAGMYHMIMKEQ